jgi:hypothetical protein
MHRPTTFQLHRDPVENMYADRFELGYAAQDRVKDKAPKHAPATSPRSSSFTLDVYGFAVTTESVDSRYRLTDITKQLRLYLCRGVGLPVSFLCACRHHKRPVAQDTAIVVKCCVRSVTCSNYNTLLVPNCDKFTHSKNEIQCKTTDRH